MTDDLVSLEEAEKIAEEQREWLATNESTWGDTEDERRVWREVFRDQIDFGRLARTVVSLYRASDRALADRRALALDAVRDALGATEHEGAVDAAKRVIAQRDAARREGAEAMRKACVTLLWAKARKENDYGDMNPNCRAGEGASERAFALENASVDVANLSAEEVSRG